MAIGIIRNLGGGGSGTLAKGTVFENGTITELGQKYGLNVIAENEITTNAPTSTITKTYNCVSSAKSCKFLVYYTVTCSVTNSSYTTNSTYINDTKVANNIISSTPTSQRSGNIQTEETNEVVAILNFSTQSSSEQHYKLAITKVVAV